MTIFTAREVAAAEELTMRGLAYAYEHLPDLDPNLASEVLGLIRQGILLAHDQDQSMISSWAERLLWKKTPIQRIPQLLDAKELDVSESTLSKDRWTVRGVTVLPNEILDIHGTSTIQIVDEFEEIRFNNNYVLVGTGIRIADSAKRGLDGVVLPLFLVDMGRNNFQGWIGNSPEGIYRFHEVYRPISQANTVQITRPGNTLRPVFQLRDAYIKKPAKN